MSQEQAMKWATIAIAAVGTIGYFIRAVKK